MKTAHTCDWTDEHGLYDGSWKGLIVNDAFAHPAKFARGLICWIIEHGLEQGYWHRGLTLTVNQELLEYITCHAQVEILESDASIAGKASATSQPDVQDVETECLASETLPVGGLKASAPSAGKHSVSLTQPRKPIVPQNVPTDEPAKGKDRLSVGSVENSSRDTSIENSVRAAVSPKLPKETSTPRETRPTETVGEKAILESLARDTGSGKAAVHKTDTTVQNGAHSAEALSSQANVLDVEPQTNPYRSITLSRIASSDATTNRSWCRCVLPVTEKLRKILRSCSGNSLTATKASFLRHSSDVTLHLKYPPEENDPAYLVPSLLADPFAGIGCGGIIAASNGLRWIGVELEPRFVELAKDNFALHWRTWDGFGDPRPQIIEGDSREFARLVAEQVEGVVTSPPYAESVQGPQQHGIDWSKAGPATGNRQRGEGSRNEETLKAQAGGYGETEGQIGSLPAGQIEGAVTSPPFLDARSDTTPSVKGKTAPTKHDPENWSGVEGVVTSPPYAETVKGDHAEQETAQESRDKRETPGGSLGQSQRHGGYGETEGQIGALQEGELDGAITSPPFMSSDSRRPSDETAHKFHGDQKYTEHDAAIRGPLGGDRNSAEAKEARAERLLATKNIGAIVVEGNRRLINTETYWQAVAQVYCQMWLAMKPGAVAAIVLKDYVKNKQRVPLCDDTCRLLESLGFHVFARTRAWLVKETRHPDLFGGEDHVQRTERKSFFRRLAERKGSPRIDWEEILWCRR